LEERRDPNTGISPTRANVHGLKPQRANGREPIGQHSHRRTTDRREPRARDAGDEMAAWSLGGPWHLTRQREPDGDDAPQHRGETPSHPDG
jgi:hypothetical protein